MAAVEETALWTTAKIRGMRELMPYCRIGDVVDAGLAKRQAASEYLKRLVAIDVLSEVKSGREKLFVNKRLLKLLSSERAANVMPRTRRTMLQCRT